MAILSRWRTDIAVEVRTLQPTVPSPVGLIAVLVIGLYVLNAGYGFAGCLRPLGDFHFISRALDRSDSSVREISQMTGDLDHGVKSLDASTDRQNWAISSAA